jgi:hypothetical protein
VGGAGAGSPILRRIQRPIAIWILPGNSSARRRNKPALKEGDCSIRFRIGERRRASHRWVNSPLFLRIERGYYLFLVADRARSADFFPPFCTFNLHPAKKPSEMLGLAL